MDNICQILDIWFDISPKYLISVMPSWGDNLGQLFINDVSF